MEFVDLLKVDKVTDTMLEIEKMLEPSFFSFLPKCFQKLYSSEVLKQGLFCKELTLKACIMTTVAFTASVD